MKSTRLNNTSWMTGRSLALVCRLALVAGTSLLPFYAEAETPKLPKAEQVLEDYVTATGGKAAYDRIQNRVTKTKVTLPAAGISMDMTICLAKPGKAYTVTESPATGKIEQGCDGEVVWQNSALTGPQLKKGRERADLINAGILDRWTYWPSAFQKVECVGVETVEQRACYKVVAQPKGEGNAQTLFFDQTSKLLVKLATKVESAMGAVPMESYFSDYRTVDGVMLPHQVKAVFSQLGREMVSKVVA
jgi:outer membrane lipoprotein-sorting protein